MAGCSTSKQTLCWKCKNAVPSADGTYGCNWSRSLQPVEGWEATPSPHNSFHIINCPEFIPDDPQL